KRRWLPKPPVKAEVIDPETSRLLSKERKKYRKELAKAQRLELNALKREKRVQEKLKKAERESQVQIKEAVDAVYARYEGRSESLKKDIARLNASIYREASRIY
ncbi:hypothetical protein BDM02DRAFT_3118991, partial [Thelephora ganbajun]